MDPLLKIYVRAQTAAMRLRDRRTDEGGVADEAAMLAIMLSGAVIIGGIVVTLLTDAENRLKDIVIPG